MKRITIQPVSYKNKKWLTLIFDYDKKLIEKIKNISGCRWSKSEKCWYMPYREDYRKYLIEIFYVFESKFIYKQLIPKVRTNKKVEEKEKINFNYNKTEGLLYFKIPFEKKDEIK
ncbi:MAG: hypothetical protein K8R58_04920, partial [Bacteroidales bacterium]|nr:hypothetical protein [Bacteroidales bacterium]